MRAVEADPPIPPPRHEFGGRTGWGEWLAQSRIAQAILSRNIGEEARAVEPNPTILREAEYHADENEEGEGLKKVQGIVISGLVLSLAACAGTPEPMLRSNAKFQLQGREATKLDVAACQRKAELSGLKPGTENRSGNMAAGAGLGLISGAAAGASAGLIGGLAGVAIGAAAGGALGVIIGSVGGANRPLEPDPPYADAVVRCLIEKGYEVTGWQ